MSTTVTGPHANGVVVPAKDRRPMTVPDFMAAKLRGVKLTMLTAYDYTLARLLDDAGVDAILVGDSLGMVMQGEPHSLRVTLDEMVDDSLREPIPLAERAVPP